MTTQRTADTRQDLDAAEAMRAELDQALIGVDSAVRFALEQYDAYCHIWSDLKRDRAGQRKFPLREDVLRELDLAGISEPDRIDLATTLGITAKIVRQARQDGQGAAIVERVRAELRRTAERWAVCTAKTWAELDGWRDNAAAAVIKAFELAHREREATERAVADLERWWNADPGDLVRVRAMLLTLGRDVPTREWFTWATESSPVGDQTRPIDPERRDRIDAALVYLRDFRVLLPAIRLGDNTGPPVAYGAEAAEASTTPQSPRERGRRRKEAKVLWLAKAMLTVRDRPTLTDGEIAGIVGIHQSQLSRTPEYQKAASEARNRKTQRKI